MTRLVKLADDALGEGILIDDDRQLVSQILVPSRYQTDHITDVTIMATPTEVYSLQMQLIANQKYWMWPVTGAVLTFPDAAKSHQVN
ncbi:hypothetical protein FQP82_08015 [Weissella cibaria]|jgi:hypothetical protein|uniref:hypothetical protein n=1 Tax=Weissella TaxID=46255 RepID=UPI0002191763|nr:MULTISPECIES: hypothetical protein [Weissella]APS27112.1 hypothetical protein AUC63_01091 [Weissella cibaria]APU62509.1 hypothetical protein AUC65_00696 [Weissella cibaria]APU64661.1 hypothetical protein AUC62_00690 [Weissella cibaria]ASS51961.1 hypothetical protein CHR48_00996 [Weissella cibaria]KXU03777.1 hypothetical protein WEIDD23_01756 [Weissella sp. DD23]